MTIQIMTANKLSDGTVVFLGYDGEWTRFVDDARIAERDEDVAEMETESAQSSEVVDPYLVDVEVRAVEGSGRFIKPTQYRERIRAFGPSTHPAFAKKLVPDHFDPRADASSVFMSGI